MPNLMPENTSVTRSDMRQFIEDELTLEEIREELVLRGLTDVEVEKAINDLSSYN